MHRIDDLKIKHVFLDMDGTLNPFESPTGEIDVQTFGSGYFIRKKPLYAVLWGILDKYGHAEKYIISATPGAEAPEKGFLDEKNKWLDSKPVSSILPIKPENRYFIRFKVDDKVDILMNIIDELGLKKEEVLLVDDEFKILVKAERMGINAMNPSTLAVAGETYLIDKGFIDVDAVSKSLPVSNQKVIAFRPNNKIVSK